MTDFDAMPREGRAERVAKPMHLKRSRRPGSVADAMLIQWRALQAAEAVLFHAAGAGDVAAVLRAVHASTQAATAYAKLVETVDLEARIAALEAAEEARTATGPMNLRRAV